MKKISLTIFCMAIALCTVAQDLALNAVAGSNASDEAPAFTWSGTEHDFGKIATGVPVSHEFPFTNSGTIPLVITAVQAPCGCTVTAYSREPVAPGAKGFVKATYDAAKPGHFVKTLTVNANTEQGVVELTIKGEVTAAGKAE